jgi:hypothetical protein
MVIPFVLLPLRSVAMAGSACTWCCAWRNALHRSSRYAACLRNCSLQESTNLIFWADIPAAPASGRLVLFAERNLNDAMHDAEEASKIARESIKIAHRKSQDAQRAIAEARHIVEAAKIRSEQVPQAPTKSRSCQQRVDGPRRNRDRAAARLSRAVFRSMRID